MVATSTVVLEDLDRTRQPPTCDRLLQVDLAPVGAALALQSSSAMSVAVTSRRAARGACLHVKRARPSRLAAIAGLLDGRRLVPRAIRSRFSISTHGPRLPARQAR
jgi:hypothetical protein